MITRDELTDLLASRLRESLAQAEIEKLVADILALENGWEELNIVQSDMGYSVSAACSDICWLADQVDRGAVFKIYRKRQP